MATYAISSWSSLTKKGISMSIIFEKIPIIVSAFFSLITSIRKKKYCFHS